MKALCISNSGSTKYFDIEPRVGAIYNAVNLSTHMYDEEWIVVDEIKPAAAPTTHYLRRDFITDLSILSPLEKEIYGCNTL